MVGCGGTNLRCLSTLPSDPKASPLYALVEDHFDEFEGIYEERFSDRHGFWRPVLRKVADRFLNCGNLRHGFARIRCENPDCRRDDPGVLLSRKKYAEWINMLSAGLWAKMNSAILRVLGFTHHYPLCIFLSF